MALDMAIEVAEESSSKVRRRVVGRPLPRASYRSTTVTICEVDVVISMPNMLASISAPFTTIDMSSRVIS